MHDDIHGRDQALGQHSHRILASRLTALLWIVPVNWRLLNTHLERVNTMLTRKTYKAQAAIIKKHIPTAGRDFCYEMATDLADYYGKDNPRFDRARFLEACGLGIA